MQAAIISSMTALFGVVIGIVISQWFEGRRDRSTYARDWRRSSYSAFVRACEGIYFDLDEYLRQDVADAAGLAARIQPQLRDFEIARADIDLLGTPIARSAAYEARLAIDATLQELSDRSPEPRSDVTMTRLARARATFVIEARREVGVALFKASPGSEVLPGDDA
jgi:hypothetical protein